MGATGTGEAVETFRNPSYPRLGWGCILVLLVCAVWVTAALGEDRLLAAPYALVTLAGSVVAYRAYVVARIEASPAGVRVVNPFGTKELSWSEIDHVSSERILTLHRSDGSHVTVWAVQAANAARIAGRRSRADDVADRLRELRPTPR